MPEKYFATIMKKTPVNESDYIYTVDSVTAGDIDKETQILTTATGEKYKPVTDFSDFDESQLYYSNIIEVDQISAAFKDQLPFSDAISLTILVKELNTVDIGNTRMFLTIDSISSIINLIFISSSFEERYKEFKS